MDFRKAERNDLDLVMKLANSSDWLKPNSSFMFSVKYLEGYLSNPNVIIVCEDFGVVVGALLASVYPSQSFAYIDFIVVDSAYQRQGIGTKLYSFFEQNFCEGLSCVDFSINVDNLNMRDWASKMGFECGNTFVFHEKKLRASA